MLARLSFLASEQADATAGFLLLLLLLLLMMMMMRRQRHRLHRRSFFTHPHADSAALINVHTSTHAHIHKCRADWLTDWLAGWLHGFLPLSLARSSLPAASPGDNPARVRTALHRTSPSSPRRRLSLRGRPAGRPAGKAEKCCRIFPLPQDGPPRARWTDRLIHYRCVWAYVRAWVDGWVDG